VQQCCEELGETASTPSDSGGSLSDLPKLTSGNWVDVTGRQMNLLVFECKHKAVYFGDTSELEMGKGSLVPEVWCGSQDLSQKNWPDESAICGGPKATPERMRYEETQKKIQQQRLDLALDGQKLNETQQHAVLLTRKLICADDTFPLAVQLAWAVTGGSRFLPPSATKQTIGSQHRLRLSCGESSMKLATLFRDTEGTNFGVMRTTDDCCAHAGVYGDSARIYEKMEKDWTTDHAYRLCKTTGASCDGRNKYEDHMLEKVPYVCYRGLTKTSDDLKARCKSDFDLKIHECETCDCKDENNDTQYVHIHITHNLLNTTTEQRHPACSVWFAHMDTTMRSLVARIRQELIAHKTHVCTAKAM
jgi:hypothetical protein